MRFSLKSKRVSIGISGNEIALRFSLMGQGYSKISIDKAIGIANKRLAAKAPPMKEKPQITYKIFDEENKAIVSEIKLKKGFWKTISEFFK